MSDDFPIGFNSATHTAIQLWNNATLEAVSRTAGIKTNHLGHKVNTQYQTLKKGKRGKPIRNAEKDVQDKQAGYEKNPNAETLKNLNQAKSLHHKANADFDADAQSRLSKFENPISAYNSVILESDTGLNRTDTAIAAGTKSWHQMLDGTFQTPGIPDWLARKVATGFSRAHVIGGGEDVAAAEQ